MKPRYIVAEVSKNWAPHDRDALLVSNLFETLIAVNIARGYTLHSFQLHRMMTGPNLMNETIIAVFECTVAESEAARG